MSNKELITTLESQVSRLEQAIKSFETLGASTALIVAARVELNKVKQIVEAFELLDNNLEN